MKPSFMTRLLKDSIKNAQTDSCPGKNNVLCMMSKRLFAVSEEAQHHQEHIDEIKVKR